MISPDHQTFLPSSFDTASLDIQLTYLTEEAGIQGDALNAERFHTQQCECTQVLLEALYHSTLYLHYFTKIKLF